VTGYCYENQKPIKFQPSLFFKSALRCDIMSITKAQVLTEVKARTARAELSASDIEKELEAILLDLSTRWPFLQKTSTVTIAASGVNASLPSDYRSLYGVTDASGRSLEKITFKQWVAFYNISTDTAAQIDYYTTFQEKLYIYPAPTGETVLTLYYAYQDSSADAITLPGCFSEAIIEGVCWKVCEGKFDRDNATQFEKSYETQIASLIQRFAERME